MRIRILLVFLSVCDIYLAPSVKITSSSGKNDESAHARWLGIVRTQSFTATLQLRGGGKGGCKAKHLGTAKEGRRVLVGKHAFPNLNLGSKWGREQDQKELAKTGDAKGGNVAAKDDDDDDETDSVESYR